MHDSLWCQNRTNSVKITTSTSTHPAAVAETNPVLQQHSPWAGRTESPQQVRARGSAEVWLPASILRWHRYALAAGKGLAKALTCSRTSLFQSSTSALAFGFARIQPLPWLIPAHRKDSLAHLGLPQLCGPVGCHRCAAAPGHYLQPHSGMVGTPHGCCPCSLFKGSTTTNASRSSLKAATEGQLGQGCSFSLFAWGLT